jgi:hypothetical protein
MVEQEFCGVVGVYDDDEVFAGRQPVLRSRCIP